VASFKLKGDPRAFEKRLVGLITSKYAAALVGALKSKVPKVREAVVTRSVAGKKSVAIDVDVKYYSGRELSCVYKLKFSTVDRRSFRRSMGGSMSEDEAYLVNKMTTLGDALIEKCTSDSFSIEDVSGRRVGGVFVSSVKAEEMIGAVEGVRS
jgi:hypothetical protein